MQVLYNVEVVFDQTEQACDVCFHHAAPNEGMYVIVFDALWMLENGWKKMFMKNRGGKKFARKTEKYSKTELEQKYRKKWTQNIEIITLKKRDFFHLKECGVKNLFMSWQRRCETISDCYFVIFSLYFPFKIVHSSRIQFCFRGLWGQIWIHFNNTLMRMCGKLCSWPTWTAWCLRCPTSCITTVVREERTSGILLCHCKVCQKLIDLF